MKMWEGKRSQHLRRHSDSSLPGYRRRIDNNLACSDENRIPPLHDLPSDRDDEEEIDDDWFAKLVNLNEPSSSFFDGDDSRYKQLTPEGPPSDKTKWPLRLGIDKLRKRGSVKITEADPCHKVAYLGNVLTGWAKGEGCVEKPLATLWKNYTTSAKPDVQMKLTVTQSGLKAWTKDHGLTEYWSHRVTYCAAPPHMPRLFCWVYRHEGRKLKQELRCHAVLCGKASTARRMATVLRLRLAQALSEFKRDKLLKQNARLSLANSVYDNPSLPRRKILLSTGGHNYRPPLERSKSAPKLMVIEETIEEDDTALKPTTEQINETPLNNRKVDIKITNLNFVKKLCSSIENLVESTSKKLGERRCGKEVVPTRRPEESILKRPEEELPEKRPRKSVTFEELPQIDKLEENVKFAKCTEYRMIETSEESDESLQSISSGGSCEGRPDMGNALALPLSLEMTRLHFDREVEGAELDSLSEDEEEVVSDESGFVELDGAVQRLSLDSKEKDTPFHQIIRQPMLRPCPLESSCLHV